MSMAAIEARRTAAVAMVVARVNAAYDGLVQRVRRVQEAKQQSTREVLEASTGLRDVAAAMQRVVDEPSDAAVLLSRDVGAAVGAAVAVSVAVQDKAARVIAGSDAADVCMALGDVGAVAAAAMVVVVVPDAGRVWERGACMQAVAAGSVTCEAATVTWTGCEPCGDAGWYDVETRADGGADGNGAVRV